MPFSVRGVQKLVQQKGSLEESIPGQVKAAFRNPKELIAGQFGFQPAPAYIQNSPALNRAHEYDMANMPPGTRTQAQAEKQRLRNAIAIQYRSGHPDHAAIANLVREGKLTQKEVNSAIVTAKTDPLVRACTPAAPRSAVEGLCRRRSEGAAAAAPDYREEDRRRSERDGSAKTRRLTGCPSKRAAQGACGSEFRDSTRCCDALGPKHVGENGECWILEWLADHGGLRC
jgi:hypothetical protein